MSGDGSHTHAEIAELQAEVAALKEAVCDLATAAGLDLEICDDGTRDPTGGPGGGD